MPSYLRNEWFLVKRILAVRHIPLYYKRICLSTSFYSSRYCGPLVSILLDVSSLESVKLYYMKLWCVAVEHESVP